MNQFFSAGPMHGRSLGVPVFVLTLFSLALGLLYFFIRGFSLNVPYWDDYNAILNFASSWTLAPSWGERAALLFKAQNEHRIFFGRILILLSMLITKEVNFRVLFGFSLLGIPVLLCALYTMVGAFIPRIWKPLFFLPALILLQPAYYETVIWPTPGVTLLWIFTISFGAFALLRHGTTVAFAIATLLGLIAILSYGNGSFLLPCMAFAECLARRGGWRMRFITLITVWIGATWFGISQNLQHSMGTDFFESTRDIPLLINYFFSLIGSALAPFDVAWSMYFGIFLLAALFFSIASPRRFENPELLSLLLFLYASVGAAALIRTKNGLVTALSSRYQLISLLIILLTYFLFSERIRNYRILFLTTTTAFVGALLFIVHSYVMAQPALALHRSFIIYPTLEWASAPGEVAPAFPSISDGTKILRTAEEANVYHLQVEEMARDISVPVSDLKIPRPSDKISYSIDRAVKNKYIYSLFGWACIPSLSSEKEKIYVVLEAKDDTRIYTTQTIDRTDITKHFSALTGREINHDRAGFIVRIGMRDVPPDLLRTGILIVHGRRRYLTWMKDV